MSGVVSKSCRKVTVKSLATLDVLYKHNQKSLRLIFIRGKKLSARVFSSDPSREHAQTEQEEAAIFLISERYFIVYLHSTVACRCLLCLFRCLFSSLPVPLGAPVSYFHFRGFFGLVVLRYRMVRDSVVCLSSIAWYRFFSF